MNFSSQLMYIVQQIRSKQKKLEDKLDKILEKLEEKDGD